MDNMVRCPADLLATLTVLHECVERELQRVVVAVSQLRLEGTPDEQRSLRRLLSQARERIQGALARQRLLLWNLSMGGDPAGVEARSEGGERISRSGSANVVQTSARPIHAQQQRQQDPDPRAEGDICAEQALEVGGELEWKRDTLISMRRLLQRKAGNKNDSSSSHAEVDRAAIKRDILKIDDALEQLQWVLRGGSCSSRQIDRRGGAKYISDEIRPRAQVRGEPAPTAAESNNNVKRELRHDARVFNVDHISGSHRSSGNFSARSTCQVGQRVPVAVDTASSAARSSCSSALRERQGGQEANKESGRPSSLSRQMAELQLPE